MTTEMDWVPVESCTLPTAEQPLRVAEFDALFAAHLSGAELLDDTRARLTLDPGPDVAGRARDLAARETSCCSFFEFTVDDGFDGVRLDVAVPPAHAPVLAALVARAESTRDRARP